MNKPTKKDVIYWIIIGVLVIAVITVSVLWGVTAKKKKEAEDPSYYEKKCASFAVQNTNLSQGQIVFIGDSITDFYPLDTYYSNLPLATYNRGIAGDVTSGVYRRLKTSLFDIAPSKIVLLIGINDINIGQTVEGIVVNYTSILQEIKENLPSAQVFCISVLPMNETVKAYGVDLDTATARIKALNDNILTLAGKQGYTYVELFSHLADENDHLLASYSDDGLHLNANGFAIWTSVLKPYLE